MASLIQFMSGATADYEEGTICDLALSAKSISPVLGVPTENGFLFVSQVDYLLDQYEPAPTRLLSLRAAKIALNVSIKGGR